MKIRKIFTALFIASLLVWNASVEIMAMNTGFSTGKMEIEDQQIFLKNVGLSLVNKEPEKKSISCYDVNENGLIAIGTNNSTQKSVSVFTSDGDYRYGYSFNCSGSFGIEWDDNNLIIYFVRSDVAASFDATGATKELKIIEDTTDNNSYWNHSVFSLQRTIGGNQYMMKNNMGFFNVFSSSYSQLVKTDLEGVTTIIYDVSAAYKTQTIIIFIAVLLCTIFAVSVIIWQFIKIKTPA